jgi:hypothetical protein
MTAYHRNFGLVGRDLAPVIRNLEYADARRADLAKLMLYLIGVANGLVAGIGLGMMIAEVWL